MAEAVSAAGWPGSRGAEHKAQRPAIFSLLISAAIAALLLPLGSPPRPRLLWNPSSSSPVGLYLVLPARPAARGDYVVAWLPPDARRLAAARGYLPMTVPLVKRVEATAGAVVCARARTILVYGRRAAGRRNKDASGRAMPWWSGCRRLRKGELFLLSTSSADSFDGRYFGITRTAELIGKARPIWLS